MSLVETVEQRIKQQINSNTKMLDLKIDLLEYIQSSTNLFDKENQNKDTIETHKFRLVELDKQDALLMQMPNINESGYYAGIVALRSYIKKFHPELKVEIIDPIIDYFYLNPPDKTSEFFNLFNNYSKQGQYKLMFEHTEFLDMFNNYVSRYIDKCEPEIFGLSIIDGNIDASLAMAHLVKAKYPHIKVVIGGNGIEKFNFGYLPGTYIVTNYPFIDFFVRGDGEETFVELLKSKRTKEELKQIQGLVWWDNHNIVYNPQRTNINMDILPYPDYTPLEDNFYYKSRYRWSVPLVMSRGCPYRCSFCSVPEYIPQFRHRTVDSVIEEVEHWVNKGRYNFFCHDSIINGNPKWLKEFSEKIIAKGYGDGVIIWGGNMRLQQQMRDLDTMRLYYRAGLRKMITGFESASHPVLKHMKKYTDVQGVREIFENVRIINKERDFSTPGNKDALLFSMQLIIGYLNETEENFQETVNFIKEYRDCIEEILTCSAFLLHETLIKRWINEGEYLEVNNTVNFTTNYNTPEQRLDRLNRIEQVFKDLNLKYNVYNRGLYHELKSIKAGDNFDIVYNVHKKLEK
jgi:radical SAM superfamily enzyme YgiQ (UPF0313 family)